MRLSSPLIGRSVPLIRPMSRCCFLAQCTTLGRHLRHVSKMLNAVNVSYTSVQSDSKIIDVSNLPFLSLLWTCFSALLYRESLTNHRMALNAHCLFISLALFLFLSSLSFVNVLIEKLRETNGKARVLLLLVKQGMTFKYYLSW